MKLEKKVTQFDETGIVSLKNYSFMKNVNSTQKFSKQMPKTKNPRSAKYSITKPRNYISILKIKEPTIFYGDKEDPNRMIFGISFSTSMQTVMEEVYDYPVFSFIAEFGGALGLFLGFSFMMFWDVAENILKKITAVNK